MTTRKTTRKQGRRPAATRAAADSDRIEVANVNHPGSTRHVDGPKCRAMRRALLRKLPRRAPGLTLAEALAAAVPLLPESLFPGGAQAGWWFKTVQLDLEARGVIAREKTSPLRVHRC